MAKLAAATPCDSTYTDIGAESHSNIPSFSRMSPKNLILTDMHPLSQENETSGLPDKSFP